MVRGQKPWDVLGSVLISVMTVNVEYINPPTIFEWREQDTTDRYVVTAPLCPDFCYKLIDFVDRYPVKIHQRSDKS